MTPELGLILGILALVVGFCVWLSKGGGARVKAKILKQELKDVQAFDEAGEEWDGRGGLGGIIMRRRKGSLRKKLGLDK